MIIFVHQPEYMSWLGFFDKLARCDTFVIYDDAQFQHGGFHNRNKIRTALGWEWLTVPIMHGHPQTIKDVKIAGTQWKNKHLSAITNNYEKTPYFKEYFPLIKEAIDFDHELLLSLNLHLIRTFAEILSIKVNIVRSSEFPYCGKEKNEKLVSMCRSMGADTYLSGSGGKAYINESLFSQANIKIQWHYYEHPIYKQRYEGFQPNMPIIDLLFNTGPQAKEIILKGGTINISNLLDNLALPKTLIIELEVCTIPFFSNLLRFSCQKDVLHQRSYSPQDKRNRIVHTPNVVLAFFSEIGRVIVNFVPLPSVLSTEILPPCASTKRLQIDKPNDVSCLLCAAIENFAKLPKNQQFELRKNKNYTLEITAMSVKAS